MVHFIVKYIDNFNNGVNKRLNNKQIDKLEKNLMRVKGALVPETKVISKYPTLRMLRSIKDSNKSMVFKRAEDELSWIGARKAMVEVVRPDREELELMNDEDIKKATKELRSIYIYTKLVQPLERNVACWFQS